MERGPLGRLVGRSQGLHPSRSRRRQPRFIIFRQYLPLVPHALPHGPAQGRQHEIHFPGGPVRHHTGLHDVHQPRRAHRAQSHRRRRREALPAPHHLHRRTGNAPPSLHAAVGPALLPAAPEQRRPPSSARSSRTFSTSTACGGNYSSSPTRRILSSTTTAISSACTATSRAWSKRPAGPASISAKKSRNT